MNSLIKKPSAWLPVVLSLAIIAVLVYFFTVYGIVHDEDEGVAAHLFQLWLVLEVLMIPFFAIKWLPQQPKQAAVILAFQILALLIGCFPVFYFKL